MSTVSPLPPGGCVAGCPARAPGRDDLGPERGADHEPTPHGPVLEEACDGNLPDGSPVLARWPAAQGPPDPAAHSPGDHNFGDHSLGELCDHLVAAVHAPLRAELPRLEALARRVAATHGDAHPTLRALGTTLADLADGVQTHLLKAEVMLFPALRHLEAGRVAEAPFGSHLQAPLELLEAEHRAAGAALARLRDLSHGFAAPPGACASWRALLEGLAQLERDLQQQIRLEHRLFERARAQFGAVAG